MISDSPQPKRPEVELHFSARKVEIWWRGKHWVSFGITDDRRAAIAIPNEAADALTTHLPWNVQYIDFYTYKQDHEQGGYPMGLPRVTRSPATTEAIKAPPRARKSAPDAVAVEHIGEGPKAQVINAILDSYLDHPDQSRAERISITNAIAEATKERKYAVAAVRAHLTMGSYGDFRALLAARATARLSTVPQPRANRRRGGVNQRAGQLR